MIIPRILVRREQNLSIDLIWLVCGYEYSADSLRGISTRIIDHTTNANGHTLFLYLIIGGHAFGWNSLEGFITIKTIYSKGKEINAQTPGAVSFQNPLIGFTLKVNRYNQQRISMGMSAMLSKDCSY